MYEVLIDLSELNPEFHHQLMTHIFFEFKDDITLNVANNSLQEVHPGNYRVTKWANRDNSYDLSVYAEFHSKEEYVAWFLKSQS